MNPVRIQISEAGFNFLTHVNAIHQIIPGGSGRETTHKFNSLFFKTPSFRSYGGHGLNLAGFGLMARNAFDS